MLLATFREKHFTDSATGVHLLSTIHRKLDIKGYLICVWTNNLFFKDWYEHKWTFNGHKYYIKIVLGRESIILQ